MGRHCCVQGRVRCGQRNNAANTLKTPRRRHGAARGRSRGCECTAACALQACARAQPHICVRCTRDTEHFARPPHTHAAARELPTGGGAGRGIHIATLKHSHAPAERKREGKENTAARRGPEQARVVWTRNSRRHMHTRRKRDREREQTHAYAEGAPKWTPVKSVCPTWNA